MAVTTIGFHVTDRCQLDCDHCLRDPSLKPTDLPVSLIERVLDQVGTQYGCKHVALTGGEPTLHPEFPAILDAIVARGFTWHPVTNGKRFASILAMLDEKPARRE